MQEQKINELLGVETDESVGDDYRPSLHISDGALQAIKAKLVAEFPEYKEMFDSLEEKIASGEIVPDGSVWSRGE
jgi:hypothetical protein